MASGGAATKRPGGKKQRKQTPQQDGAAQKRQRKDSTDSSAKARADAGPPPPKVAELERFLFGSSDIPTAGAREEEEQPLSLIWEDRSGAAAALQLAGADSSDSDREEDSSSEDAAAGGRPAPGAGSGSEGDGSDGSDSDSDELNPSRLNSLLHSYGLAGAGAASSSGESESEGSEGEGGEQADLRKQSGRQAGPRGGPAWEDPEDAAVKVNLAAHNRLRKLRTKESQTVVDGTTYEAALRKQHASLHPRTSWAELAPQAGRAARRRRPGFGSDSDDEDDRREEEELLQSAGGLLAAGGGGLLPPGVVETSRMKDGNVQEPSEGVVQAVRFHPGGQLLLTASLDKRLRLFQVDGVRNPKVQSVFLPDLPVRCAAFVGDGGSHVVATGRRAHFYLYDIAAGSVNRVAAPAGRREERSLETFAVTPPGVAEPLVAFNCDQGYVSLVSLRTRQWVANLKMNGTARCCAFSPDGSELVTLGGDGILHTWDMRTRRCLSRQADEGGLGAAALAVAPDGRHLATGSSMGAVNLYRQPARGEGGVGAGGKLEMVKTLLNLTTVVDSLAFSPDSQMMAMASRMKRDSLRLVHLPSATVFSNWPTQRTPLHYVHSLDFSPRGGFLAIGNAKGRALLYRLHHYAEA